MKTLLLIALHKSSNTFATDGKQTDKIKSGGSSELAPATSHAPATKFQLEADIPVVVDVPL